jgi:hypothetical protein
VVFVGSFLLLLELINVSILHNYCRRLFDYILPLCYYYYPRCQYVHRGIRNNPHNHRLPLHYLSASVYFHLSGLLYLVRAFLESTHGLYCTSKLTCLLYSSSATTWSEWDGWSSSSSSKSTTPAAAVYTSTTGWEGWTSTAATVSAGTTAAAVSTYAPAAWNATTPAYATFTGAANQVVAQAGAGLAAIVSSYIWHDM